MRAVLPAAGAVLTVAALAACGEPECDGACVVFQLTVDLEDGVPVETAGVVVDGPPRMMCSGTAEGLLCTTDSVPLVDYVIRVSATGYASEERRVHVEEDECCVVTGFLGHITLRRADASGSDR